MVKRTFYLVFISFMIFCIMQPVFAEFSVTVENQSDIVYKSIDLVITPVGFDAPYGRITIKEEIKPGEQKQVTYKYDYLVIPLTGTSISPKDCNLNLLVVANPKRSSVPIQVYNREKILKKRPQIVQGEEYPAFSLRTPLKGIKPPDIQIILTNEAVGEDAENIKVNFFESGDE